MDIITIAIVSALGKLGETAIKDAYYALKTAIAYKCGLNSDIVKAIENLEEKPASQGRKETLKEEVSAAKVADDDEIVKVARNLLDRLEDGSMSETSINQVAGDDAIQIGQVGGDVNIKR